MMSQAEAAKATTRSGSSSLLVDERVLVLAPVGRDAELACKVLDDAGFVCLVVTTARELRTRLQKGAGALLLTEEALSSDVRGVLLKALKAQPSWSDLPLIVLAKGRQERRTKRPLEDDAALQDLSTCGNVTVLERPLRLPTLASVVQASLKARRRQYQVRDLVGQLEDLNESLERRVDERTRALQASEEQFTLAIQLSPSPTIIVDPADSCLVDANEAFSQLTGYERADAVAHTTLALDLFVKPKALEASLSDPDKVFKPPLELMIRTKLKEQRSVLVSSSLIHWNGKAMLLATLFDITERKQAEEQLMWAIQEVMSDASWFSRQVMERLAHIRSGAQEPKPDVDLSKRERQVLEYLARGTNNEQIAKELSLAVQTVRNYISTIYDKLGVHARGEAIVWARERGIV